MSKKIFAVLICIKYKKKIIYRIRNYHFIRDLIFNSRVVNFSMLVVWFYFVFIVENCQN